MRNINYKLILSDFDGTLSASDNRVPEEVKLAVAEYVNCGGVFAVCTGRMLCSILPRVRALGLKGLVAAYQGTVIADIESGEIIRRDALSYSDVAEVCAYIETLGFSINAYSDEVLYTDIRKGDEYLEKYEEITGVEAVSIADKMSDYVVRRRLDCQKIACLVAPEKRGYLYEKLAAKFNSRFDVTCSAKVLVEVSPLQNNKGEALRFIAEHYGIPLTSTVAIGDNFNDVSMIKTAAVGVAVANGETALKEAADYITVTNNECAVAKIIEKFGLV